MQYKKTQIIQFSPIRTAEEIGESISTLQKKILALKMGSFRCILSTPNIVPDISVAVHDQKVYATFLTHPSNLDPLRKILGVRLIEFIESALIDTFEHMLDLNNQSEKISSALINYISHSTKSSFKEKPTAIKKKKSVNHIFSPGKEITFYDGCKTNVSSSQPVLIVADLKNTSSKARYIKISIFRKEQDQTYSQKDTINKRVLPSSKIGISLVIPSDCRLTAKCASDGVSLKILAVENHP